MRDFILLMHRDTTAPVPGEMWASYFAMLRERGVFDGGSSIGPGGSFRKQSQPAAVSEELAGYIRVRAESLEDAQALIEGNPVYECGGTVEIRELPRD